MNTFTRKLSILPLCITLSVMLLSACTGASKVEATNPQTAAEIELTTDVESAVIKETDVNNEPVDETHSNEADPDYEVVFPQDEVNMITITISEENWALMMADMEENYGELGTKTQNNQGNAKGDRPANPGDQQNMAPGPGNEGMGNIEVDESNPIWVTATIQFEGETWENVGMRFKGNSSLRDSWSSGNLKMPFKLDFDEFEEDFPEIEDQRFYGFKQLSFSSNFSDNSYLREKVTADIFRDAGVPSAQTAFYAIYLENGTGVEYMGLYTAVEVIDDTVIETQFEDDSGNVYKPEGTCATFAAGTYNENCYDKETNQDDADYSDLALLLEALHSGLRLTDSASWRDGLESIFNVEEFINYLAVNTVVQNWDTYGVMNHNYYLYTDPDTGLINWIPWDNNMALQSSPGGNGRTAPANKNDGAVNAQQPGGGNQSAPSISLDEVGEKWPLIRYIMDDEVYSQQYVAAVENVISEVFTVEKMTAIYEKYANLIESYVKAETSAPSNSQFISAVQTLKNHVAERVSLANEYLGGLE